MEYGVQHYNSLNLGQIVAAKYYQQQLIRLSDALKRKRTYTDSGSRRVILYHDNAQLHMAKGTRNIMYRLD